tara:strand:+ start:464 stop:706 length:243 start_codon:yes stop_codon:yes gene_type:complete
MKIFFFKKSKIGHGGPTQNWILRRTTVTEFSKTFPVFYKWPDLTDIQVVLHGTVPSTNSFNTQNVSKCHRMPHEHLAGQK